MGDKMQKSMIPENLIDDLKQIILQSRQKAQTAGLPSVLPLFSGWRDLARASAKSYLDSFQITLAGA